jgi:hypothetical protein
MAISTATFQTNQVTLHLAKTKPYASRCFAEDMVKFGDTVPSIEVEKWFKRYFPSNVNQYEFRNLEANVTQTVHFKN